MKYTDLVFDLYGTLVDIHTEEDALVWEKTALYFGFYGAHYTGEELKTLNSFSVADAIRYFSGVQIKDYGDIADNIGSLSSLLEPLLGFHVILCSTLLMMSSHSLLGG